MATMTYEYPDALGVVVCGDIHGKFDELVYRMTVLGRMERMVVIVAGDCGFGFHNRLYYDEVYQRVLPRLEKADCHVVFVRGNHDNPAYFDGEEINMKRWVAVSDYSVVSAAGHRILCVGGATSVDRRNRESYDHPVHIPMPDLGKISAVRLAAILYACDKNITALTPADYWPGEQPYFDVDALKAIWSEGKTVDAVVTHVAPSRCEDVTPPSWLDYLTESDPTLPADMQHDREVMDQLLEGVREHCHPVRHWFYGHYHHSWQADIDGIRYTMLREMEMKEIY